MTANLMTTFDLYKQNAQLPLVQVQLNVEFDPQTSKATAKGLSLFCHINNTTLDVSFLMGEDLFGAIVKRTLHTTNWSQLHQDQLIHEHNRLERIEDNQRCGITDGPTETYLQTQQ